MLRSEVGLLPSCRSRLAIYKEGAATIECVNAQIRKRGLRQFLARGLEKVRAVALWHAQEPRS